MSRNNWIIVMGMFASVLLALTASAQSSFQIAIGGPGEEEFSSFSQTSDGNLIFCGTTTSFGNGQKDILIFKTDISGSILWSKTIGGPQNDECWQIKQTPDGGYIATGFTESYGSGNKDAFLLKLNDNGTISWFRTYGGGGTEYGYDILVLNNGYLLSAQTDSWGAGGNDMFVVKTTGNGTPVWGKTFGGTNHEGAYSVVPSADNQYVFTGTTGSFGNLYQAFVTKIDTSGNVTWFKTYGDIGAGLDGGRSIINANGGGYVVAGYTNSFGAGNYDLLAFKLDDAGNTNWTRTIGGASEEIAYHVTHDNSGGYLLGGYTKSFGHGNNDVFIARLDNSGNQSWARATGGAGLDGGAGGPNYKTFHSLISAGASRIMVADYTQSYGAGQGDILYGVSDGSGMFAACPDTAASTGISTPGLITSSPVITVSSPVAYSTTASPGNLNAPLSVFLICGCNNLVDLGPDTIICSGDSLVIDAGAGYSTYLWQDASAGQTFTAYTSGIYSVTVTDPNSCVYIDTLILQVLPPPLVDLGPDISICENSQYTLDAGTGFTSYHWQNNASTQSITVSAQGTYSVTVTNVCGQDADSMQIISLIPSPQPDLGNDTVICSGAQLVLDAGSGYSSYRWQDNSTSEGFMVTTTGLYSVTVTNMNNCPGSDTIYVSYKPLPVLDLGPDITLCDQRLPTTFELNNSYTSYLWQDGSTSSIYTATKPGTYSVTITDDCGTLTDEVVISPCPPCVVAVPTGFSPNGDGVNDLVHILGDGYTEVNLQIFNRQGQLLYETSDPGSGWDGTFAGADQGEEVYVYHLTATCRDGKKKDIKGNVTLVR